MHLFLIITQIQETLYPDMQTTGHADSAFSFMRTTLFHPDGRQHAHPSACSVKMAKHRKYCAKHTKINAKIVGFVHNGD